MRYTAHSSPTELKCVAYRALSSIGAVAILYGPVPACIICRTGSEGPLPVMFDEAFLYQGALRGVGSRFSTRIGFTESPCSDNQEITSVGL
jgi:hypothetical protein